MKKSGLAQSDISSATKLIKLDEAFVRQCIDLGWQNVASNNVLDLMKFTFPSLFST